MKNFGGTVHIVLKKCREKTFENLARKEDLKSEVGFKRCQNSCVQNIFLDIKIAEYPG